jgi:hypothetical protein
VRGLFAHSSQTRNFSANNRRRMQQLDCQINVYPFLGRLHYGRQYVDFQYKSRLIIRRCRCVGATINRYKNSKLLCG